MKFPTYLTFPLPLPIPLLALLSPVIALDYISTYNLQSARWDAKLIDTLNNVTCNITYTDISSLLTADAEGYLSSPIAIVIPCDNVDYIATTVVGTESSMISYTVPGKEAFVFESGKRSVLEDGEVIQLVYGVAFD